ncbi:hypothetical protein Tco_0844304, partial [Tanacetum coccineum]
MRDENPIRTLGDYSKPSYKGYRNTIELPEGNNMIIMVNKIPPDHMDDVPVVEPNQHDDVLVILEPVLVDKD